MKKKKKKIETQFHSPLWIENKLIILLVFVIPCRKNESRVSLPAEGARKVLYSWGEDAKIEGIQKTRIIVRPL